MKKTRINLARTAMMLLLAMLGSAGAWAQSEVINVGSGNNSSGYLPSYPNNTYSLS